MMRCGRDELDATSGRTKRRGPTLQHDAWASLAKKPMPQSSPITAPIVTLPVVTLSVSVMEEMGTQIMELVLTAGLIVAGAIISGFTFPRAP